MNIPPPPSSRFNSLYLKKLGIFLSLLRFLNMPRMELELRKINTSNADFNICSKEQTSTRI